MHTDAACAHSGAPTVTRYPSGDTFLPPACALLTPPPALLKVRSGSCSDTSSVEISACDAHTPGTALARTLSLLLGRELVTSMDDDVKAEVLPVRRKSDPNSVCAIECWDCVDASPLSGLLISGDPRPLVTLTGSTNTGEVDYTPFGRSVHQGAACAYTHRSAGADVSLFATSH